MQTILCIDDSRSHLASLSVILHNQGYCCITAENSVQADRLFVANAVDLAIVDHGFADIDGSALAIRLKSIRPVLVLMLTGNLAIRSKPAGVDRLLAKPIHPKSLLNEIEHLLLQRAA